MRLVVIGLAGDESVRHGGDVNETAGDGLMVMIVASEATLERPVRAYRLR